VLQSRRWERQKKLDEKKAYSRIVKNLSESLGLTQSALAKHIGVLPKTINEICRRKRGISAEMAMKLSKALGGSPQFWLNLQNNWEISQLDESVFEGIEHVPA
jgi:addiction module HigA family antidote